MKCSFEETVEILMDAAIYAETDYMRAVSENCMIGQTAPIGTGVFDLYMDDRIETQADGAQSCALDYATPTLPHMKDLEFNTSPNALSPSMNTPPANTPYASPLAQQPRLTSPSDPLPTPVVTPGDNDDAEMGRLAARTPFSPMGGATPMSQPGSAGRSPASDMSSPATPNESSQFRSPSYTPADESPTGTSPANDEFSPSYASMASPAYTPDGSSYQGRPEDATTSPSYHSYAAGSSNNRSEFSPTSWSMDRHTSEYGGPAAARMGRRDVQPFSPTSQAYSPGASSPVAGAAFDPTSPVDTPMGGDMSPQGQLSPQGYAPGSPLVQPQYGSAPDSPYQIAPVSPSYTPVPGRQAGGGEEQFQEYEPGTDIISNEGDSDDEGASMFDQDDQDAS